MKRIAVVLATVTGAIGSLVSSANAHGFGYGYWGGYSLGYYRDYTPVGTYDGYIPVTHTRYTTYNDAPAYLGYRYRIVVHPPHVKRHQLRW